MLDTKIDTLEKRIEDLTKSDEALHSKIRELQLELDNIVQSIKQNPQPQSEVSNTKLTYLTEVNEQMFQQNVRLRQLIEKCMETQIAPTHEQYYTALKGEE